MRNSGVQCAFGIGDRENFTNSNGPTLKNPLLDLEDEEPRRVESSNFGTGSSSLSRHFPRAEGKSSMDFYPERYDEKSSSSVVELLSGVRGDESCLERSQRSRRRSRRSQSIDLPQNAPATEESNVSKINCRNSKLRTTQQIYRNNRTATQQTTASSDSNNCCCSRASRESMRFPPYLATLLILSYGFIGIADACSSRSTPKPRPPTPTPRPNITFHMYTCPPDYAEFYCLNGATCFTVKIVDSLLYNCLCANGYIGQRCEFKDLDGSYLPSRQRVMLETASIAGAVTIAVFLAVITFISVYIHCKRKQKELRLSAAQDAVDSPCRVPELRPFCTRGMRSHMIFMAKPPNRTSPAVTIEQTRMPGWNLFPIDVPATPSMRLTPVADPSISPHHHHQQHHPHDKSWANYP